MSKAFSRLVTKVKTLRSDRFDRVGLYDEASFLHVEFFYNSIIKTQLSNTSIRPIRISYSLDPLAAEASREQAIRMFY